MAILFLFASLVSGSILFFVLFLFLLLLGLALFASLVSCSVLFSFGRVRVRRESGDRFVDGDGVHFETVLTSLRKLYPGRCIAVTLIFRM